MTQVRCPMCDALVNWPAAKCARCGTPLKLAEFTHQDQIFMHAAELGCTPVWVINWWECRCPHAVHGNSVTSPVITFGSLDRMVTE